MELYSSIPLYSMLGMWLGTSLNGPGKHYDIFWFVCLGSLFCAERCIWLL